MSGNIKVIVIKSQSRTQPSMKIYIINNINTVDL